MSVIVQLEDATEAQRAAMAQGSHYDYVVQEWRDGHDHYHRDACGQWYCGADLATCRHDYARSA